MTDTDDDIPLEPWARDLKPREQLFVREYLANGMKAYPALIKAGWAKSGCSHIASSIMRRPRIVRAVALAMAERAEILGITSRTVLSEAFRCYLLSVEKGNLAAAARFLDMVGRNCEVGAFVAKFGGLVPTDEDDAQGLENLTDEEVNDLARITRKMSGAGEHTPPASKLN